MEESWYDAAFARLGAVQVPPRPAYAGHAYQSYGLLLTPECRARRDDLLRALIDLGISCRRGIAPIHLEPLYRHRYGPTSLPVTEMVAAKSMFLPMYASLSEVDQVRIIDAVVGFLTRST